MLYVGMTNSLSRRMQEHFDYRGRNIAFAEKHYCYALIYWETFHTPKDLLQREKEVKKWNRKKKQELVNRFNPEWRSYNDWVSKHRL